MAELKKNRRKIERCALEFYLVERCALWDLGRQMDNMTIIMKIFFLLNIPIYMHGDLKPLAKAFYFRALFSVSHSNYLQ